MKTKKVQVVVLVDGLGRYAFQGWDGDTVDDQIKAANAFLNGDYDDAFLPHPLRQATVVEVEVEIPEPKVVSLVPEPAPPAKVDARMDIRPGFPRLPEVYGASEKPEPVLAHPALGDPKPWVDPRPYVTCDPFSRQPENKKPVPLYTPLTAEELAEDEEDRKEFRDLFEPEIYTAQEPPRDNQEVIEEERSVTVTHRQTRRTQDFDPEYEPPRKAHGSLVAENRDKIHRLLHENGPLRQVDLCKMGGISQGAITYALKHWKFEKTDDGRYRLAHGVEAPAPKRKPIEAAPIERAPEMEPVPAKDGILSMSDYKENAITVLKKYKQLYEYDLARLARIPTGALSYVLKDERFEEMTPKRWRLIKALR